MTRREEQRKNQAEMIDRLNRNLIEVGEWQERLDRARERYATNQKKQLAFDRVQDQINAQRKRFRQLKEECLQLDI